MNGQPKVTGASSGFGNLTTRALTEAGHLVYAGMCATTGRNAPAVAADRFPHRCADVYDVNVLSTQRVNRTALPLMRAQSQEFLVWVGSSSTCGGHPPFLAPYFTAKAAMDALA